MAKTIPTFESVAAAFRHDSPSHVSSQSHIWLSHMLHPGRLVTVSAIHQRVISLTEIIFTSMPSNGQCHLADTKGNYVFSQRITTIIIHSEIYIYMYIYIYIPPPLPPHVHMNFAVPPPGCGRSVTDFWVWGAHRARLRCPDDVSEDTYVWMWSTRWDLKPKFYRLPRP
jgi:hypothetical protein